MEPLKYYITESPLSNGFMAKTIVNNTFDESDFINRMCINESTLDRDVVKKVMRTLISTAGEVLAEGNSISISEFLRITPVVKGHFDSISGGFDSSRNYVGVTCTVLQTFVKDFQKLVSVEKTEKPSNMPQILYIENNKTKDNIMRLPYANRIFGINMELGGYNLGGIKLMDSSNIANSTTITGDYMEILKHSSKELYFNFSRDFTPPDWLTDNLEIYVQLRFESTEGSASKESDMFESSWISAKV